MFDNEFFEKLKSSLERLPQDLSSAQQKGLDYIPSVISPEFLIFDVRQPQLRSEQWDELNEREHIEAFFYSFPDYLFRDRIYAHPQYLHIHLRRVHQSAAHFREKVKELATLQIPGILKVYHNHEFRQPKYHLSEVVTRWAEEEMHIASLRPGEKVIDNIPVALSEKSYLFIKLLKDDMSEDPYLTLTSETHNFKACLEVALSIIRFFMTCS